ncbi:unnamed protein product [Miscanthus lutarioriparius]|uniref:Uncharacterized protein n=1 Tax=Miscanthus lutarioriparius TaxID=422564 RepID=A0A811QVJ2_9POAL|nr:unnamed protein product [Miscanthus lutarioriparius]
MEGATLRCDSRLWPLHRRDGSLPHQALSWRRCHTSTSHSTVPRLSPGGGGVGGVTGEKATCFALACSLLSRYGRQNGAATADLGLAIRGEALLAFKKEATNSDGSPHGWRSSCACLTSLDLRVQNNFMDAYRLLGIRELVDKFLELILWMRLKNLALKDKTEYIHDGDRH